MGALNFLRAQIYAFLKYSYPPITNLTYNRKFLVETARRHIKASSYDKDPYFAKTTKNVNHTMQPYMNPSRDLIWVSSATLYGST